MIFRPWQTANRGAASHPRGRLAWPALLVGLLALAPGPAPAQRRAPDVAEKLAQLEEAQRAAVAEMAQLRDRVQLLEQRVLEVGDQIRAGQDAQHADHEQAKAMREEVRGLYVESSSTKELIDKVGEQVDSLGGSLDRFRLAAGVLLAVLVVLQIIGSALVLRGRG